ncbi:hypothetical protein [Alteriqipengyuania sp. 357]
MHFHRHSATAAIAIIIAATFGAPAAAEDEKPDYLEQLAECRAIADAAERLTCYDREVGVIVAATQEGEVRLVDREEVRETRRRLFGFALPKNIFGGGDEEELDTLETTIARVDPYGRKGYVITTQEGSVWRISSPPLRFAPPKAGQKVEFKTAALGSFFIRVNGQLGVKGVRIE